MTYRVQLEFERKPSALQIEILDAIDSGIDTQGMLARFPFVLVSTRGKSRDGEEKALEWGELLHEFYAVTIDGRFNLTPIGHAMLKDARS